MKRFLFLVAFLFYVTKAFACSICYYIDNDTGKIYAMNSEDYLYNKKPYIKIIPKSATKLAHLWYGWDFVPFYPFAQGGINEKGLFYDAAVTPKKDKIQGNRNNPISNLGPEILANCTTVEEAIAFFKERKISFDYCHFLFGDKTGNAVVIEWVNGEQKLHWLKGNRLCITNFLLSDPVAGNYPCDRYGRNRKGISNDGK